MRIRPQLISDIPIENKSSTNKQESKRERYFGDTTTQFLKNRENIEQVVSLFVCYINKYRVQLCQKFLHHL